MKSRIAVSLVVFAAALAQQAAAQAKPAAPAPPPLKAEYLANYDQVTDKIQKLAAAVPEEKWDWRPAKDVRSVGEVYQHVAEGNYFLLSQAGLPVSADEQKMLKAAKGKKEISAALAKAIASTRATIAAATPEQMEHKVNFFGQEMTSRAVLLALLTHLHEHLGQSIAYARSNGVVPPWSKG